MKLLTARRLLRRTEHELERMSLNRLIRGANKAWHGVRLNQPDWSNWSHSVALSAEIMQERHFVHWILNAYWEPLDFELPPVSEKGSGPWRRWIDTALESPHDIVAWQTAAPFTDQTYLAGPRSVVVLYAPLGASR